jgi:hypothetical protein
MPHRPELRTAAAIAGTATLAHSPPSAETSSLDVSPPPLTSWAVGAATVPGPARAASSPSASGRNKPTSRTKGDSMPRKLIALIGVATAALVATGAPAGASEQTPDCYAVAWQQPCIAPVDGQFTDTFMCDFPVHVTMSGWIRYRPFFDDAGNLTRDENHALYRTTIVNPATGRSFTDRTDANVHARYLPDGSIELRGTGLFYNARVDDGQRLLHQSGNYSVLLGPDGQPSNERYHGNFQSDAGFPGTACPILAQPL